MLQNVTDPREAIAYKQNNFSDGLLETSFADYYMLPSRDSSDTILQVQPKGYNGFVPLCAKPNCLHNNEDCNAFCTPSDALGYYHGRLYAIDSSWDNAGGYDVVSLLPDGTDRKMVADVPYPLYSDGTSGGMYLFVFHENRLIIWLDPGTDVPLEEQVFRLLILDLETGTYSEPFRDYLTPFVRPGYAIQPVGSILYNYCSFRNPDDGSLEDWWVAMNMDTGEVRKLFCGNHTTTVTIDETTLYYLEPNTGCMEYNLATGETANRGLPVADGLWEKVDRDWVYVATDASDLNDFRTMDVSIHFLDRDYVKVDELHLEENMKPQYVDEDYLYFVYFGSDQICARMDKSKIGTGSLTLEPVGNA